MKKMILIANLYPSKKFPYYGTFVKKFADMAKERFDVKMVVLTKENNKIIKLIKYLNFYVRIVLSIICSKDAMVYVHYASHAALPILICKKIKDFELYVNVHGSDVYPQGKNEKLQSLTRKLLESSDCVVVPSTYFENCVLEKYNLKNIPIKVFPSGGIDSKKFIVKNKNIILDRENMSSDFRYIGFASRLEKEKGAHLYLKAIKMLQEKNTELLKSVKFILIGSGECEKEIDDYIVSNSLTNHIIRYPLLDQQRLADIYNVLEWFVFPTSRKSESLGLVGLEAMACGAPVIASNYAGPISYIENGINGFLFEVNSSIDLYNKMVQVIQMPFEDYEIIKKNAISTTKAYLDINLNDSFNNIFERKE